MPHPLSGLTPDEKRKLFKMFEIMSEPSDTSHEDMMYVVNNVSPMVEILKKTISNRMIDSGISAEETDALLSTLIGVSNMAGGVSFADFAHTESMAEDLSDN